MSPLNFTHILTQAVDELSESESYKGLFHQHKDGEPLPSAKVLYEIIELSRSILFPGYYGNSTINSRTINYHIGVNIEKLFGLLSVLEISLFPDEKLRCLTLSFFMLGITTYIRRHPKLTGLFLVKK